MPRATSAAWAVAVVAVLAVVAGVIGTGGVAATAAAAPAMGWRLQPSPLVRGTSQAGLTSTSCWTTADCVAVGWQFNDVGAIVPLAEGTSGGAWTLEHLAVPPGSTSFSLTAVACPADGGCFAVGVATLVGGEQTLVEQRQSDGGWVVAPAPNLPKDRELKGVSCGSATDCVAVGTRDSEVYDGTTWRVVPVAVAGGAKGVTLRALSCPSTAGCLAVGTAANAPLAEMWDGAAWRVIVQPVAPLDPVGVSCTALDACTVIGATAERWNGTSWQDQDINKAVFALWRDVSCSTATRCVAVGVVPQECCGYPAAAIWTNGTWRLARLKNGVADGNSGELESVDCSTATACVTVGSVGIGIPEDPQAQVAVVLQGNGSVFYAQQAATPAGPGLSGAMSAVSCWAVGGCISVGSRINTHGNSVALIETLSAGRWVRYAGEVNAEALNGVSCASATDCVAVDTNDGSAAIWNGSTWAVTTLPAPAGTYGFEPTAVACVSATDCVAVGSASLRSVFAVEPAIERYDGSRWVIQHAALPTAVPPGALEPEEPLTAVSCANADTCEAVGYYSYYDNGDADGIYAESWSGGHWSAQTLPASPASGPILTGLSCPTIIFCLAVGAAGDTTFPTALLAYQWNGTTWSVLTPPAPTSQPYNALTAVACRSSVACSVVGYGRDSTFAGSFFETVPAAESLNGATWTVQVVPSPPGGGSLTSVSCPSAQACFSVGTAYPDQGTNPFDEAYRS
jgi:hypothetical protein